MANACLPLVSTTMMMMRTSMRERYNIPGSLIDDWAGLMFCGPCALSDCKRDETSAGCLCKNLKNVK
ncbi:unnamed protein product [Oncorhynchus mykiss]|uniref:Uncharacterized protein n=1 Tax=Oncorhynchus mykiss TaxID=8022 RepID=A0A060XUJ2_ONCMY|nr:unnamed protein product [Oncorhynchus mykiss]